MVGAVSEAVHAQRPRIAARHHAHPRRDGDGGRDAFQFAVDASVRQRFQVRQPVQTFSKHKLRRQAVDADERDSFRFFHHFAFIAKRGWELTFMLPLCAVKML